MIRHDAIQLLKTNVAVWNEYREEYPKWTPYLYDADFSNTDLRKANLWNAYLKGANFDRADLRGATLRAANLGWASLKNANIQHAVLVRSNLMVANLSGANLQGANIRGATLKEANLNNANLTEADLVGADLTSCFVDKTQFKNCYLGSNIADVDLSTALNLDKVIHFSPSSIGIDTIIKSKFDFPKSFLEGAGIPRQILEYFPEFKNASIDYYSCFISYSHKDDEFTKHLYDSLKSEGLRIWYAPEEMKGGRTLHDQIDHAIHHYDKLLLVLSETSMQSDWVQTEIYKARKKEKKTGKRMLFPISISDFETVKCWNCFDADTGRDMASDIRQFYIPDFSNWNNHDSFTNELSKLLGALRESEND